MQFFYMRKTMAEHRQFVPKENQKTFTFVTCTKKRTGRFPAMNQAELDSRRHAMFMRVLCFDSGGPACMSIQSVWTHTHTKQNKEPSGVFSPGGHRKPQTTFLWLFNAAAFALSSRLPANKIGFPSRTKETLTRGKNKMLPISRQFPF